MLFRSVYALSEKVGTQTAMREGSPCRIEIATGCFFVGVLEGTDEPVLELHAAILDAKSLDHPVTIEQVALPPPGAFEQTGAVTVQCSTQIARKRAFYDSVVGMLLRQGGCQAKR